MKFSPARARKAARWFGRYTHAVESRRFADAIEPRRQLEALGYRILIAAPVSAEAPARPSTATLSDPTPSTATYRRRQG